MFEKVIWQQLLELQRDLRKRSVRSEWTE
jgi:hypothetical protein